MHIFLPSTIPALARLLEEGRLEDTPPAVFAADPGPGEDEEEARYQAMYVARVGEGVVRVEVTGTVPRKKLASAHVDDVGASEDVAEAAADPTSGAAEGHELMWFAVQELRHLVQEG